MVEIKYKILYSIRYNIMLQCWKSKPTLRPSFTDLVQSIGNLLDESVKMVRKKKTLLSISFNVP